MKKLILFILGLVCAVTIVHAQSPPEIKPLHIGDTVPDIVLNDIIRYKTTSAKISDFKGKVVILDFFATWCSSCIEALKDLNALQEYFGSKLQVMVVDYEDKAKITDFLRRNSQIKDHSLSFIAKDTILHKLFPHHALPHEVIIDPKGIVRAITYIHYVTRKNIQALINGQKLNLPLKKELDYKRDVPLLYKGNGGDLSNISIRSTFCNYIDGLESHYGFFKDSIHQRLFYTNGSILWLYFIATNEKLLPNRVILEVKDSTHYINYFEVPYFQWRKKNTYCYELIAPISMSSTALHALMLDDLNRYLHINGRIEKRLVNCWVLIRFIQSDSLYKTKGGRQKDSYDKKSGVYKIRDLSITRIVNDMNSQAIGHPPVPIVLDETGYKGKVDMDLKVKDIHDITKMNIALKPYGFKLVKTKRRINMLVLTEMGQYLPNQLEKKLTERN